MCDSCLVAWDTIDTLSLHPSALHHTHTQGNQQGHTLILQGLWEKRNNIISFVFISILLQHHSTLNLKGESCQSLKNKLFMRINIIKKRSYHYKILYNDFNIYPMKSTCGQSSRQTPIVAPSGSGCVGVAAGDPLGPILKNCFLR